MQPQLSSHPLSSHGGYRHKIIVSHRSQTTPHRQHHKTMAAINNTKTHHHTYHHHLQSHNLRSPELLKRSSLFMYTLTLPKDLCRVRNMISLMGTPLLLLLVT